MVHSIYLLPLSTLNTEIVKVNGLLLEVCGYLGGFSLPMYAQGRMSKSFTFLTCTYLQFTYHLLYTYNLVCTVHLFLFMKCNFWEGSGREGMTTETMPLNDKVFNITSNKLDMINSPSNPVYPYPSMIK